MIAPFEDLLRRLSLDVTGLANALRALLASPIWQGRTVSVSMASGSTTATVQHGLGRPLQGAWVVGATYGAPYALGASGDDSVQVSVPSALGADSDLTLWVY